MSTASYIFGILSAVLVLVIIIEMLRRGSLRERHAIWWLLGGMIALVIGVFPSILQWTADALGVAVPTNLVFFASITVLFLAHLQHSAELTRLEAKTRTLAEKVAMLDLRLREAEDRDGDSAGKRDIN
ncbi:MAG: DUF2304 domain-containing protein [Microbacterium sp.]|nr:DUF2304 domain-containing protein [Microbacterium sp.]MBA4346848.1 DUF2304 domain-containing protein [Microbacterium sp.]